MSIPQTELETFPATNTEIVKSLKSRKIKIRTPKDILPLLGSMRESEQEMVIAVTLDGNNKVTGTYIVSIGLANQAQIHPREVMKWAIRNSAVSIMVTHNHPSGNLEPSEADLIATRRLVEVGKIIGIPLLDDVIVSDESFLSIRERFPAYFG